MSFLKKLWSGEFPLWKTYWLCLFLPNLVVGGVLLPLLMSVVDLNSPTECISGSILIIAFLCYVVIAMVGLWRSADNYRGNALWKYLAKIIVAGGFIYFVLGIFEMITTP